MPSKSEWLCYPTFIKTLVPKIEPHFIEQETKLLCAGYTTSELALKHILLSRN